MTELLGVVFAVADVTAEERLIREYVAPAIDRLDDRDDARWPTFNRYGQDPAVDDGEVVLSVLGDAGAVVRDERPYWDDLVADGLAREWRVERRDATLDERDRFRYRIRAAASRMSLQFLDRFDDCPDAVDEFDDPEFRVGWSLCLHHLVNQLGYQAEGGDEEIELLSECIESRLHALAVAPGFGADAAAERSTELAADLESLAADLRRSDGRRRP